VVNSLTLPDSARSEFSRPICFRIQRNIRARARTPIPAHTHLYKLFQPTFRPLLLHIIVIITAVQLHTQPCSARSFVLSLVLSFHLLPTVSMPRCIAGKTLPGQAGRTPVAGSRARAAAVPSGSRGQSSGDAPATRRSEPPKGLDDGTGSPRTIIPNAVPLDPRPAAVDTKASTASGTNPVSSSKRPSTLLPPSYTAFAQPPSLASVDPCLSCVKRMDRSPGNGCPRVPHMACSRCTKAKRKYESVSTLFLPVLPPSVPLRGPDRSVC
jgi:hypothetical protein